MKRIIFSFLLLLGGWSLSAKTVTWNILQTTDSLHDGVKVMIGNTAKDYGLGLYNYSVAKSNIRGAAATYGPLRHTITANDSLAYTLKDCGKGQWALQGSDGKYLYMYNTNKNLSSNDTINNQAKWTITIQDSTARIKSVYSTSWSVFFNKTAANPLYCTYSSTPQSDANLADVYIYSDNAPEWKERVLQPSLLLKQGDDTLTTLLDWGKVIYDDSWGTTVDPYCESKTITVIAKDLSSPIAISLAKATVFTSPTTSLPAKGGSFSVQFSTKNAGTYTDTLYVDVDTIHYAILLKAETSTGEETQPKLTLSTNSLSLNPCWDNNLNDLQMFTFSVSNLQKNLYIKWEKGTIPDNAGDTMEILAGDEEVHFGSSTIMGTEDRTDVEVYVSVTAYTPGTYTSTICFYTPDAEDKDKNVFEKRVTLTVIVRDDYGPATGLIDTSLLPTEDGKFLHEGHILLRRNGHIYTLTGHPIQ